MFVNSKPLQRVWRLFSIILIITAFVMVCVVYDLPGVQSLIQILDQPSVRIVDRNDRLLHEIIAADGGRNAALSFGNIPQCIEDATIAVEDKNFYRNPGVDLEGILRAIWINLKGGEVVAGGSTITQQVARTLLLSEDERMERTLRGGGSLLCRSIYQTMTVNYFWWSLVLAMDANPGI